MDLTAHDAATTRFRGTRYAYDRREVDRFRERVVAALAAYEAALAASSKRIADLERTTGKGSVRSAQRAGSATFRRPTTVTLTSAGVPEPFDEWRQEAVATAEVDAVMELAREEARMIRAVAAEQAAEEIARLTAEARANALQVTQRAADLATRTEEAARERAGEIVEAAVTSDPAADAAVLKQRMLDLRATIATVQERLAALAVDAEDSEDETPAEVIALDLRDDEADGDVGDQPPAGKKRSRSGAKQKSVPTTDELAEQGSRLRKRLESD